MNRPARFSNLICLMILMTAFLQCSQPEDKTAQNDKNAGPTLEAPKLKLNNKSAKFKAQEIMQSNVPMSAAVRSESGRTFIAYPNYFDRYDLGLVELEANGPVPFPSAEVSQWKAGDKALSSFINVQDLEIDEKNNLWVLDAGKVKFGPKIKKGAKLVAINLRTNRLSKRISFHDKIAGKNSFLSDMVIDKKNRYAYVADRGEGGIITIDLSNHQMRRMLYGHSSTQSDGSSLKINDQEVMINNQPMDWKVNSLALDQNNEFLYWQAINGKTIYRIKTADLIDTKMTAAELGQKVEGFGEHRPVDGMNFGADGQLYVASVEDQSIYRISQEGVKQLVITDSRLSWPDALNPLPDGGWLVTSSQIHKAGKPDQPYFLLQIQAE